MEWSRLFTVEMAVMVIILVTVLFVGAAILLRMRPLKDFEQIKLGKLELVRKDDDAQYKKLLEFAADFNSKLDMTNKRLDGVDGRLDRQYGFIRKALVTAGTAVSWSDKGAPFEETCQAILTNIALKQNSNLDSRLVDVVMGRPTGIKDFNSVYNSFINNKDNEDLLKDNAQFFERVKEATKGLK